MNLYLTFLLMVLLICMYALILSFGIKTKILKILSSILVFGIGLRYIALLIYLISESPLYLYELRHLILLSAISIPILSFICVKRINKHKLEKSDLLFASALAIIFIYIVIMSPDKIVSDDMGYKLLLKQQFIYYLSAIQGFFSVYMIYFASKYLFRKTLTYVKIINSMFFTGYIIAVGEGLALLFDKTILKSPVLSEMILTFTIALALREFKREKN